MRLHRKYILPALVIASLSTYSASAEEGNGEQKPADRLLELFEQYSDEAEGFFEDLMEELGPGIEGLREQIDDLNAYEAPEILPNGDIIIRRKKPLPSSPENEDGTTDL